MRTDAYVSKAEWKANAERLYGINQELGKLCEQQNADIQLIRCLIKEPAWVRFFMAFMFLKEIDAILSKYNTPEEKGSQKDEDTARGQSEEANDSRVVAEAKSDRAG
jgi:hypothetical protein